NILTHSRLPAVCRRIITCSFGVFCVLCACTDIGFRADLGSCSPLPRDRSLATTLPYSVPLRCQCTPSCGSSDDCRANHTDTHTARNCTSLAKAHRPCTRTATVRRQTAQQKSVHTAKNTPPLHTRTITRTAGLRLTMDTRMQF